MFLTAVNKKLYTLQNSRYVILPDGLDDMLDAVGISN